MLSRKFLYRGALLLLLALLLIGGAVAGFPSLFGHAQALVARMLPDASAPADNALEVVFVADYSGTGRLAGEDLTRGFKEALAANGVANDLRLVVRDDKGQQDAAAALAEGAASAFQTLALIGPGSSTGFDAFVEAAAQGAVPVIVPVAPPKTAEQSKWVFTMQPSQQRQAELVGHLIQKLGPVRRLAFVNTKGVGGGYWNGVTASFADASVETMTMRQLDLGAKPDEIAALGRQLTAFDLVFIDLPSSVLVPLITSLRDADYAGRVVGFGDMALPDFPLKFIGLPKEHLAPGFYTTGLFAVAPFSPDISGERGRQFSDAYHARTGKDPSWAYAYGYDTGTLLADFISARKAAGKDPRGAGPEEWRQALRDYLDATKVAIRPTSAFTGPVIFDLARQRDTQPALVLYQDRRPSPYLLQYSGQPARLLTGGGGDPESEVVIGEHRYDLVPVAFTGLRFHSIDVIDLEKSEYTADFEVWFRSRLEIGPEDVVFPGAVDGTLDLKVVESLDTPTEKYRRIRVKGRIRFQASPRDLVLERISLPLVLRHRTLEANRLRFVVDSASFNSVSVNSQVHEQIRRDGAMASQLGYVGVGSLLAIENRVSRGLGDPRARSGHRVFSELGLQLQLDSASATLGPTLARTIHWSLALVSMVILLAGCLASRRYRRRGGRLLHWSVVLQIVLFSVALLLAEVSLFGSSMLESTPQRWVVWIRNAFTLSYYVATAFLVNALLWWFIRMRRGGRLVQGTIYLLTSSVIFFCAFAAYYTNVLGRDFLPILATSSVLLTVIGLALRELILDAISGISLSMENTLKVGHWILLKTREQTIHGVIEEMGWRNIRVRSRDDQIHFVPNSLMFQTVVSNFSMMKGFTRVSIPFEVSSNIDLGRVIEEVSEAVSALLAHDPNADTSRPLQVICTEIESDTVEMTAQVFYRADCSFDTLSTQVLRTVNQSLLRLDAMPVHKVSLSKAA